MCHDFFRWGIIDIIGHHNITHGGESRLGNLKTPIGNYDEDLFQSRVMDKNLILNHHLTQQYILVIGR